MELSKTLNLLETLNIKYAKVNVRLKNSNGNDGSGISLLQLLRTSPNFKLWAFLDMENAEDNPSDKKLRLLSAIQKALDQHPDLILVSARPWNAQKRRSQLLLVERKFLEMYFHKARELPYVNLLATPLRTVYRRSAYVADYKTVDQIFCLLGLGPYKADGLALGLTTEGPGRLRRDPERGRMYQFRAWTGRGVAKGLVLELEPRRWMRAYERSRGEVRRVLEHLIRTHGVLLTPDTVKTGFQEGPAELVMGETNVWFRRTKIALSNQIIQLIPPDRSLTLARIVASQIDQLLDHLRSPEGLYELAAGRLKAAAAAGRPYLLGGRLSALEIAAASAAVEYTGKAREKLASGKTPLPGELVVPTRGIKNAIEQLLVYRTRQLIRRFGLEAPGGITVVCADGYEVRWWRLGVLAIPERVARALNADSDGDYVGALVATYGDRKVIMAFRYPLVGPPAFFTVPVDVRTPWDASESDAVRSLFDAMGVRLEGDEVRHDLLDVGSSGTKSTMEIKDFEGGIEEAPVIALQRMALCRTGQLTRLYERLIARYWQEPDKRDLLAERIRQAAHCIEQQVTALKKNVPLEKEPSLAITNEEKLLELLKLLNSKYWNKTIPTSHYRDLCKIINIKELEEFGNHPLSPCSTKEERIMRTIAKYAVDKIRSAIGNIRNDTKHLKNLLNGLEVNSQTDSKHVDQAMEFAKKWLESWKALNKRLQKIDDEKKQIQLRRNLWKKLQKELENIRLNLPIQARAQAAMRLIGEGHDSIAFHLLGPDLAHLFPRNSFQRAKSTSESQVIVFVPKASFEVGEEFEVRRVTITNDGLEIETNRDTFQAILAHGESLPKQLNFHYAIATTRTRLLLRASNNKI